MNKFVELRFVGALWETMPTTSAAGAVMVSLYEHDACGIHWVFDMDVACLKLARYLGKTRAQCLQAPFKDLTRCAS